MALGAPLLLSISHCVFLGAICLWVLNEMVRIG